MSNRRNEPFVNADFGHEFTVFLLLVISFEIGSPTRENTVKIVGFYGCSSRLWSWLQALVGNFEQCQCQYFLEIHSLLPYISKLLHSP